MHVLHRPVELAANVSGNVKHPPFHLDYVDARRVPNAHAFQHEGYSFIAITKPLIEMLWQISARLSRSATIAQLLGIDPATAQLESLHCTFFSTQLSYLVAHEYTHHTHEHDVGSEVWNEIRDIETTGGLETQAQEVDADGYGVYIVLAHLINGRRRTQALRLLGCPAAPEGSADEVLLASFILAVGAFFYARSPAMVDNNTVYTFTHPPQALRMNYVMHNTISWCKQNRPSLEAWLTLNRYQLLMRAVAEVTWGPTGGRNWSEQTAFLSCAAGDEYTRQLSKQVDALISKLSKTA